jgi:hypothetical protein
MSTTCHPARMINSAAKWTRSFETGARAVATTNVLLAAIVTFGAAAISLSFGQDSNWDLRSYHFYNPYALLHDRYLVDIAPAGIQTYLNPLLDLPFYALVALHLPASVNAVAMALPSAVAAFFSGKLAWELIYATAPKIAGTLWLLACVLSFSGAAALPLVGTTMTDPHVAAVVLAAAYCGLRSTRSYGEDARTAVCLSGLLAGVATGLKLTAAPYAIGLFVAIAVTHRNGRAGGAKAAAWFALASLAGFALAAGYWMWILYRHFDSPLFPFYNSIFQSEFWEPLNFADLRFRSASIWDLATVPYRLLRTTSGVLIEGLIRDWRLAAVAVTGAVALLVIWGGWNRRSMGASAPVARAFLPPHRFFVIFCGVAYVLWAHVFTYYRYAVPLEMCSGALIMIFVATSVRRDSTRIFVALAIGCSVLATTLYPTWGRVPFAASSILVSTPPLPNGSLVILTDRQPAAYLIPYFASDARFISPWWTINDPRFYEFTNPAYTNRLQSRITAAIASHSGPIYSIGLNRSVTEELVDTSPGSSTAILGTYRLAKDHPTCRTIRSNLDGELLAICQLRRT